MKQNELLYGNSKEKYETPQLQDFSGLMTREIITTSPGNSGGFLGEWDEDGF